MTSNAQDTLVRLAIWAVVIAGAFALASGIVDGSGRKDYQHFGPVPAGVTKVTEDTYLVPVRRSPGSICKETSGEVDNAVEATVALPSLGRNFVRCSRAQTWNDHRAGSSNYRHAMMSVLRSPLFLGPFALTFLLAVPAWWTLPGTWRKRKARGIERRHKRATFEEKRIALAAAYAKGDISEETFELKLEELLNN